MLEHQQTQQSTESKHTFQKQATPLIQTHPSNPASIIQRAKINPKSLISADVLQLQRTIGNRVVGRLLSEIISPSKAQQAPIQRQEIQEEEPLQGVFEKKPKQSTCPSCSTASIQQKEENRTGMTDNLKSGVENLSGIDMSDVRVRFNSSKPAEIGAFAYTQGTEIHVAPGQERHLPHEAWHVVQQAQRRVRPTFQMKGVAVNEDEGLEREADILGQRMKDVKLRTTVSQIYESSNRHFKPEQTSHSKIPIQLRKLVPNTLNLVGERHDESDKVRTTETYFSRIRTKGPYWQEGEFKMFDEHSQYFGDAPILRFVFWCSQIKELLDSMLKIGVIPRGNYYSVDQKLDELLSNMKLKIFDYIAEGQLELERFQERFQKSESKFIPYSVFQKINTAMKTYNLSYFKYLLIQLQEDIRSINTGQAFNDEKNSSLKRYQEELAKIVSDLSGSQLSVEVSRIRSIAMFKAFMYARGKDVKGVWKVGQEHINDLSKDPLMGKELTSREEFIEELNSWSLKEYGNLVISSPNALIITGAPAPVPPPLSSAPSVPSISSNAPQITRKRM
jgi:hypothetical protein